MKKVKPLRAAFSPARFLAGPIVTGLVLTFSSPLVQAQTTIVSENFESYTTVAASIDDTQDADPSAPFVVTNDNPHGGEPGSGVQVVGWAGRSGTKSLLVRSGAETVLQLLEPRSGSRYQLDFHINSHMGTGDRNFYLITRAMGIDSNGDDFIAYRADRGTSAGIFYYEGIGPNASAWHAVPGVDRAEDDWQHHRFIINNDTKTYDLFIDDMENPVLAGAMLSRPAPSVPISIIIRHEGNTEDDGYFLIDDISLTVAGSRDLTAPFTEGFENYPVAANFDDDANPGIPWITSEVDGSGNGRPLLPSKVQVVGSAFTEPRSGNNSLKIEGGQQAGITYAWGTTPEQDVQITWWAKVPESVPGTEANYLRVSLYGVEGGRSDQGDAALLGYGSRSASVGDATSLTYYNGGWVDSQIDYTPEEWEEYRLVTHCLEGTYSIIKSPSSEFPEIIADRLPFIGGAAAYGPMFMVGFSSSNASNNGVIDSHPPIYIDDIDIRAVISEIGEPTPPYTPVAEEDTFDKSTVIRLPGALAGAAVDPRDNETIVVAVDVDSGGLFQVKRNTAGEWELDTNPLVSGLARPSGVVIDAAGTIWWTHDYTQSLRRLKAPWRENSQETVIASFADPAADDDPVDLVIAGPHFEGTLGQPGWIVVAERHVDGTASNFRALHIFDPSAIGLNQTGFSDYLVEPTTELGGGVLNAIASLDALGEIAVANDDGTLTAVNADGDIRYITHSANITRPMAIATDPTTGRLWIGDRESAEIWSIDPSVTPTDDARLEVTFPLVDEVAESFKLLINDPGLTFSPDGRLLIVSDGSTQNRGGWLSILEREIAVTPVVGPITITAASFSGTVFTLSWQAEGATKYRVWRSPALGSPYVDISNELTTTTFTDSSPLPGQAFYKVSAE